MQFVYADELKTKFSVFGHFYDLEIGGKLFNCRSVLEIISKPIGNPDKSVPNTIVVMMNPGSSRPLNNHYIPQKYLPSEIMSKSWNKEVVPTRPDNAQYQIMRLMLLQEWNHVRILNLSDLRNGNSGDFSIEYKKAERLDCTNPHSLIHKERVTELQQYCSDSPMVVAAWGTTEVLRDAAISFLSLMPNIRGLPLDKPWYRYPSPYKKDQKLDWLNKMNEELKHNKSANLIGANNVLSS